MELAEGITRRAARMGQILALLAALFLAFDPHPLLAQSDAGSGQGHLESFCEALDTDMSQSHGEDGLPSSHGDCTHHFDPLVRGPIEFGIHYVSVGVAPPHSEPVRQQNPASDPPPPRFQS